MIKVTIVKTVKLLSLIITYEEIKKYSHKVRILLRESHLQTERLTEKYFSRLNIKFETIKNVNIKIQNFVVNPKMSFYQGDSNFYDEKHSLRK